MRLRSCNVMQDALKFSRYIDVCPSLVIRVQQPLMKLRTVLFMAFLQLHCDFLFPVGGESLRVFAIIRERNSTLHLAGYAAYALQRLW
mmetsp:Transcript_30921/g.99771  ORF Transcript_30921/g.99771 Transcript_30921/m.99771 type:complete len:88 (+) Transcript_30921:2642-2905(+)